MGRDLKDAEVAFELGISKVYAWQLRTGKRESIDSPAARKIEVAAGRPEGWLDTNFKMWPFVLITPEQILTLSEDDRKMVENVALRLIQGSTILRPKENVSSKNRASDPLEQPSWIHPGPNLKKPSGKSNSVPEETSKKRSGGNL